LKAAGGESQTSKPRRWVRQGGDLEAQPPAAGNYAGVSPQKVVSFFDEFEVVHQNRGEM